jgi:hypothetical protein
MNVGDTIHTLDPATGTEVAEVVTNMHTTDDDVLIVWTRPE